MRSCPSLTASTHSYLQSHVNIYENLKINNNSIIVNKEVAADAAVGGAVLP